MNTGVLLYWLPLGAGGHFVRWNGRLYEALAARRDHRAARATVEGVSAAPISEAVEVAWPRRLLRGMLANIGEPYLIVRLGYVDSSDVLPVTPRRTVGEVIHIDD
jgi:hypothetical protein